MKRINGTFLEFHHLGLAEGKYINPVMANFSKKQWQALIKEIHELKMKYLVIMETANYDDDKYHEVYYPSKIYEVSTEIKCKNPIEVVLTECDKYNMKVFISVGFYTNWWHTFENITEEITFTRAFKAMDEIHQLYHAHKSFIGWYYPDETEINPYFTEEFITYVNRYSNKVHSLDPKYKTLIAPYGTCKLKVDDKYIDQLKRLDVDYVAYQDEVGVKKTTEDCTKEFYKALRIAHDKANKSKLWADMETFTFEGDVYKSALLPANKKRLLKQMEAISDYVDEIIIFQYQGIFNKPGSIAYCGHPDSIRYYNEYKEILESIKKTK